MKLQFFFRDSEEAITSGSDRKIILYKAMPNLQEGLRQAGKPSVPRRETILLQKDYFVKRAFPMRVCNKENTLKVEQNKNFHLRWNGWETKLLSTYIRCEMKNYISESLRWHNLSCGPQSCFGLCGKYIGSGSLSYYSWWAMQHYCINCCPTPQW